MTHEISYYLFFLLPFCCNSAVVTIYEKTNYEGQSLTLNVNECLPKLPIPWPVYSIKIHKAEDCVRLYTVKDCHSNDFFEMKQNSPSAENTLKYLYWHEKIKSLSPCEDYCDSEHLSKFRNEPIFGVDLYKARYLSGVKVSVTVEYGKCTTIPPEVAGKVSSLRRDKDNSCIELYENDNCSGSSVIQRGPAGIQNVLIMEVFDKKAKSISFCGFACPPPNLLPEINIQTTTEIQLPTSTEAPTTPKATRTTTTSTTTTTEPPTTQRPTTLQLSITETLTSFTSTENPVGTLFSTTSEIAVTEKISAEIGNWNSEQPQIRKPNENNLDSRVSTSEISDSSEGIQLSLMQLVLIIGGIFLFMLSLIIIVVMFLRRRNKPQADKREMQPIKLAPEFEKEILSKKEIEDFLKGCSPSEFLGELDPGGIYSQVWSQPYNSEFEISKGDVKIDKETILGFGQFAIVYKGVAKGQEVAVKTIKPSSGSQYVKALLNEIKIMIHVGTNPFIVALIGCYTQNVQHAELFLISELCENGSLLQFLQKNRDSFVNILVSLSKTRPIPEATNLSSSSNSNVYEYEQSTRKRDTIESGDFIEVDISEPISCWHFHTFHLLDWCEHVAKGMEYLASKKVIHGDLAARNILLDGNFQAKISDLGLSRQILNYSDYVKKNREPLPWRWLSIEALKSMTFSTESDMWSFGILCWEIFTLGEMPYPGRIWDQNFVLSLCRGLRPPKPKYAPDEFHLLLKLCWRANPKERISFENFLLRLEEVVLNLKNQFFNK